mmetsp:Transcript_31266/g.79738  ORF Transcript_31266/g.79738 Transcript_31266/m.79738 type:complete len:295 (+) Transcript_31266:94-978(+)
MDSHPTVSVLGTGLMGRKMAVRLAQQGFKVAVWNRDRTKADLCTGCTAHDTPASALAASQVVVTMLADAPAIRAVLLDDPAARAAMAGKTFCMMATIGPAESTQLAQELQQAGVAHYVEAPVLGSQPEAEKGALQIMVGCACDPSTTPAWPVLCALGSAPKHVGPVGAAAAIKLALNQLIAIETLGFSASLGLVQKSGANVEEFMNILRGSALYAPTFDKKLAKYISRDFGAANFPTKHLLKDVLLFSQEAEGLGLHTGVQRACEEVCRTACSTGTLAECDYSAVYEAVVHPNK